MPSRSKPAERSSPAAKGPSRGPPGAGPSSRGPSGPKRGPPGASGGPSRGPPGRGPPGGAKPVAAAPPAAKKSPVSRKVESETSEDSSPQKKVRRARIDVDMSLFEDWQADDREAAVAWVVGELAEGEQERTLLMQLQGTGWSAQQSRAIYDLARNQQ